MKTGLLKRKYLDRCREWQFYFLLPQLETVLIATTHRLLVLAATDTTSTALTQIVQLLSESQDIQDKVRAEIVQAQEEHGEDIPYDTLVNLPYLDALCREALRL